MGTTNWAVALKIDPLLLDCISLTIHQQPTTCWPQALVLATLLVSQSGDRKARCSSSQGNLVLITTSLSRQQTAYSLACHFRDSTINQIWTSSSCSHISFPTSSTRTVILLSKLRVWQTSAGHFTVGVERTNFSCPSLCCCSAEQSRQWDPASIKGVKVCMLTIIL